jgi:alcohol dehydrogenase class IV
MKMAFDFSTASRVIFGAGTSAQLADLSKSFGTRPFLVTGRDPARFGNTLKALATSGAAVQGKGEPDFTEVRLAVTLAREEDCDHVVAVGGGSVIDLGKAVAMLLGNGGDPLDYAEVIGAGRPIQKPSLPCIAVPTTAGAGSEVTRNAVVRCPQRHVKVSLRSPGMIPTVALVDPGLTVSLPPELTAATGMDALSQVLEPFVSCRANAFTDALCRDGLARIARSLRTAVENGTQEAARSDMALAALYGGMALANAGLGAVHGFAAAIGGAFAAPHGSVCAALLAPVMEMNLAAATPPVAARYTDVARILTGSVTASAADGVSWVRELARALEIPPLEAYGMTEADVDDLCAKAGAASSMQGNPVVLGLPELRSILSAALG